MKNIPVIICLLIVLGSSFIYVSKVVIISEKTDKASTYKGKAIGTIEAPPEIVWKVILDYPNYPEFMPNMAKSILLDSSFLKSITINSDYEQIEIEAILNKFIINKIMGRTFYLYSVLEMPLWFDDKWSIYKIELKETYKLERELVIGSFDFCNGGWELESDIKGNTIATFPNHFDIGYAIPKTIKDIGMNYTIPRLFEAIQSRADYFMKDEE